MQKTINAIHKTMQLLLAKVYWAIKQTPPSIPNTYTKPKQIPPEILDSLKIKPHPSSLTLTRKKREGKKM